MPPKQRKIAIMGYRSVGKSFTRFIETLRRHKIFLIARLMV